MVAGKTKLTFFSFLFLLLLLPSLAHSFLFLLPFRILFIPACSRTYRCHTLTPLTNIQHQMPAIHGREKPFVLYVSPVLLPNQPHAQCLRKQPPVLLKTNGELHTCPYLQQLRALLFVFAVVRPHGMLLLKMLITTIYPCPYERKMLMLLVAMSTSTYTDVECHHHHSVERMF